MINHAVSIGKTEARWSAHSISWLLLLFPSPSRDSIRLCFCFSLPIWENEMFFCLKPTLSIGLFIWLPDSSGTFLHQVSLYPPLALTSFLLPSSSPFTFPLLSWWGGGKNFTKFNLSFDFSATLILYLLPSLLKRIFYWTYFICPSRSTPTLFCSVSWDIGLTCCLASSGFSQWEVLKEI